MLSAPLCPLCERGAGEIVSQLFSGWLLAAAHPQQHFTQGLLRSAKRNVKHIAALKYVIRSIAFTEV